MRIGNRIAIAATAVAVVSVISAPSAATGAASAAQVTTGACSASPYYANFSANYTSDGTYDYFTLYSWSIAGYPLGARSNVEVRVKHHNALGHDPIYFTWISPDDVRSGTTRLGPTRIRVPKKMSAYVEFKVVFDRPGEPDRSCTGKTRHV